MNLTHLTRAPRLWTADPHGHRRVTWMELFFDLIFVAAVAEVGEPLAKDYSPAGLLRYAFLFVLIWWAWSGHTLYSTRFDHDDAVQRLLVLLQCFIAAVMAANAKEALDSRSSAGFGAAYAAMRVVLVAQYLRARRLPETRALTSRYAIGFGSAAVSTPMDSRLARKEGLSFDTGKPESISRIQHDQTAIRQRTCPLRVPNGHQ